MKRGFRFLLILLSCTFLFLVFTVSLAYADEEDVSEMINSRRSRDASSGVSNIALPPTTTNPGFLGQDHSYSVVFRGNGEAVVSARVVFTNQSDEDQDEISLRIPRVDPSEISVYQIIKEKTCGRYLPQAYDSQTKSYGTQTCAEYADPDYYTSYYGSSKYQKAEYELVMDTLKVTLPVAVTADRSGSFVVYYRAMGYANRNIFGAFNYTFETLKAEESIRSLTVGITTDSDLVLKGVKGEVAYRYEAPAFSALESAGANFSPQKSTAMDSYVAQIGRGKVTKTASNLTALESYTVYGAYAASYARLYCKQIVISVIVAVAVIAGLVFLVRFLLRKLKKSERQGVERTLESKGMNDKTRLFLICTGVSFVDALFVAGFTVGVFVFGQLIDNTVNYQYTGLFMIFLILISFVVYMVLLFGPAVFLGIKKGVGWGITVCVMTVFWLIVFVGVVIMFLFIFSSFGGSTPYPILEDVMY